MKIFFVIDKFEGLDEKIALINKVFDSEIKYFVNAKLASKILTNKQVVKNTIAFYSGDANSSINEYIKTEQFEPSNVLIYYSSVEMNYAELTALKDKILKNPSIVYVKNRPNWFGKLKMWFYRKVISAIFGVEDEGASIKVQYLNENVVKALAGTNFNNRIFNIPESEILELEKNKTIDKPARLKKYNIYPLIALCITFIGYVVCEAFFKLRFWMYLLFIAIILGIIINFIILLAKNTFDERFKRK